MTIQFDADFVWGAATSGPQAEGTFHKKHENIFDYHSILGHKTSTTTLVRMLPRTSTTIMKTILLC